MPPDDSSGLDDGEVSDIPAEKILGPYSPRKDASLYEPQPRNKLHANGGRRKRGRARLRPSDDTIAKRRRTSRTLSPEKTTGGAEEFLVRDEDGIIQGPGILNPPEDSESRSDAEWLHNDAMTQDQHRENNQATPAFQVSGNEEAAGTIQNGVGSTATEFHIAQHGGEDTGQNLVDLDQIFRQVRDLYSIDCIGGTSEDGHGEGTDQDDGTYEKEVSPEGNMFVTDAHDSEGSQPEQEYNEADEISDSESIEESLPAPEELVERLAESQHGPSSRFGEDRWNNSAFFDPPKSTQGIPSVSADSGSLDTLLNYMGHKEWTVEGKEWQKELLSGNKISNRDRRQLRREKNMSLGDIDNKQWLEKHRGKAKTTQCKDLLENIYRLWRVFRQIPTAAYPEEQAEHLRQEETVVGVRRYIHAIASYVDILTTKFAALPTDPNEKKLRWIKGTVKSLGRRIIPMLCLVLKEAFMLGSSKSTAKRWKEHMLDSLPRKGDFSESLLRTMLRVTEWIGTLYDVIMDELGQRLQTDDVEVRMRRLGMVRKHLEGFRGNIARALEKLGEEVNGPIRRELAMGQDRHLRQQCEEKHRKAREAQDRQMQLFLASTQQMGFTRVSTSRSALTSPASSAPVTRNSPWAPHLSPKDERAAKRGGWYWDEDDQLMTMLRTVPWPADFRVIAGALGRSSTREVTKRAGELKDMVRRKYEAMNLIPPLWCKPQ